MIVRAIRRGMRWGQAPCWHCTWSTPAHLMLDHRCDEKKKEHSTTVQYKLVCCACTLGTSCIIRTSCIILEEL